jgi:predicted MFS family arabinose efflux permease
MPVTAILPRVTSTLERYKVLAAGVASLILSLGPARFAYTPLLPLMQQQAKLGIAAAGWLASINYIGYLSGAVVVSLISDLVLKDRLYRLGLILAVATTWMMGATTHFIPWAISRYLAGVAGTAGVLLGSGLILHWLIRNNHRRELGVHFTGIGLAVVVSAGAVMAMNHWSLDWRQQWYAFTAIGAVLLLPALAWLPRPAAASAAESQTSLPDSPPSPTFLRLLMIAYFCAGVGYVVSATFIVAIVDHLSYRTGVGNLAFLVIGASAAPSSVLCDLVARRLGNLNTLILASVLQVAGILLPVLMPGLAPTLIGAALFGATVIGIVSLVLTMAGRYYPTRPASMMGRMTVAYGLAQVIAPAVTGILAAHQGDYRSGLYLAAAVMVLGAALLAAARGVEGVTEEAHRASHSSRAEAEYRHPRNARPCPAIPAVRPGPPGSTSDAADLRRRIAPAPASSPRAKRT